MLATGEEANHQPLLPALRGASDAIDPGVSDDPVTGPDTTANRRRGETERQGLLATERAELLGGKPRKCLLDAFFGRLGAESGHRRPRYGRGRDEGCGVGYCSGGVVRRAIMAGSSKSSALALRSKYAISHTHAANGINIAGTITETSTASE